jgi:phage virion morphogenesis protein
MTGINLTITINDVLARDDLREMIARIDQPAPFYNAIGNLLVASVGENFLAERAPDGTPWTPLAPATIAARRRRGSSAIAILRERGRLKGSISHQVEADGVRIGATAPYAAIHQFGGTINKSARSGKIFRRQFADGSFGRQFAKKKNKTSVATDVSIPAHSVTIPARPYLGVGANDIDDIQRLADRWLSGKL